MSCNITKIFNSLNTEAMLTTAPDLRFYLTGFASSFGVVITDNNGTVFYTDARYLEAAQNALKTSEICVKEMPNGTTAAQLISKYKSVAVPFSRLTAEEYVALSKVTQLSDSTAAFSAAMAVKEQSELKSIERACEIADAAFLKLSGTIKEGMTENDVAAELEYLMRKGGASGVSFSTIAAFGANASVPHHETGLTRLKFGDEVLIDFGCKYQGYCSDCTRTFLFGDDNAHGDFKTLYARVLTAQNMVIDALYGGISGKAADEIARGYLKTHGLDKYFTHSLGHGIGVNIHEAPYLSPKSTDILTNGMVFSDEPGVYINGSLGIRIEDTLTLKDGRAVRLTNLNKDLLIL